VTDPGSIRAAVALVLERAGRIDLLVNNAGQSLFGPLAEQPLERLDAVYQINVRGPLAVAQAVIPAMAERGWGRIANVGSMVGVVPTPWTGAYCASKAALHTLSEVLRMEVAPLGIDVIVVQPGAVRSEVASNAPTDLERYAAPGSLYRGAVEHIRRRSQASQRNPTEADAFARALADALTRARAPRVVRLGRGTGFMPILSVLPGALRDRLFARAFGLSSVCKR
jgi:NAD(P)-dependent dehydrogenase (short-subunit alcohol dehydrogenase family)